VPAQADSQQTWSTQLPDLHSPALSQRAPSAAPCGPGVDVDGGEPAEASLSTTTSGVRDTA
jgi:hypothetical protein